MDKNNFGGILGRILRVIAAIIIFWCIYLLIATYTGAVKIPVIITIDTKKEEIQALVLLFNAIASAIILVVLLFAASKVFQMGTELIRENKLEKSTLRQTEK